MDDPRVDTTSLQVPLLSHAHLSAVCWATVSLGHPLSVGELLVRRAQGQTIHLPSSPLVFLTQLVSPSISSYPG